jgi:hypothetical protein
MGPYYPTSPTKLIHGGDAGNDYFFHDDNNESCSTCELRNVHDATITAGAMFVPRFRLLRRSTDDVWRMVARIFDFPGFLQRFVQQKNRSKS